MTLRPPTRPRWAALAWALCLCLAPFASGQFGLVAPALSSLRARPGLLLLRAGGAHSAHLGADRPPTPRRSASTRESEIAAIFRGVAYGVPTTQGSNVTVAPATTSTSTSFFSASFSSPKGTAAPPTTTTTSSSSSEGVYRPFRMEEEGGSVRLVRLQEAPSGVAGEESYVLRDASNASDAAATPTPAPPTTGVFEGAGGRGRGMSGVRWSLGPAWWIHVYVSAGLLALLAAASLCCLARPSSSVLPRPHHLAIHALVFLAASLRSLRLFHDPYGVEGRLPGAWAAALEEASWPLLTGSLAVLVAALAPPPRPHTTHLLALMTGVHLLACAAAHTAAHLLPGHALPLRTVGRAVTAAWGGGVGGSGLWAAWRAECPPLSGRRGRQRRQHLLSGSDDRPGHTRATRAALVASVAQVLLATLQLYVLVAPVVPAAHAWAWWSRVSLARGLELLVGVAVLAGAALLSRGAPRCPRDAHAGDIISVLTGCGRDGRPLKGGRSANVFPATSEKQRILGGFTKRPPDRQGVPEWRPDGLDVPEWRPDRGRDRTQSDLGRGLPPHPSSSMLVNDSGFVRFRTHVDEEEVVSQQRSFPLLTKGTTPPLSYTLPATRYYCRVPSPLPIRDPIRAHTLHRGRLPSVGRGVFPPTSHDYLPPPASYEVASYYHPGSVSSHLYSTPLNASPRPPPHFLTLSRRRVGAGQDPLPGVHSGGRLRKDEEEEAPRQPGEAPEPSTCSSLSEIHVDYLTDISSSNDAFSCSLPRPYYARPRPHGALTLPLAHARPTTRPDITPDSAVVLDYSEDEEDEEEEVASPPSGGRSRLLTKFVESTVGSASRCGYSPLDVEASSSPSQEAPPSRRLTSTPTGREDLPIEAVPPDTVTSL